MKNIFLYGGSMHVYVILENFVGSGHVLTLQNFPESLTKKYIEHFLHGDLGHLSFAMPKVFSPKATKNSRWCQGVYLV